MNRWRIAGLSVAVVAVGWIGVSAQQEVLSRPGPGSGVMSVNVINHPAVTATQNGEWQMVVTNVPDVKVANMVTTRIQGPAFVTTSRTYEVTWENGDKERITPRETLDSGWVRVENAPGYRWVNLQKARAIEEVR